MLNDPKLTDFLCLKCINISLYILKLRGINQKLLGISLTSGGRLSKSHWSYKSNVNLKSCEQIEMNMYGSVKTNKSCRTTYTQIRLGIQVF